MISPQMVIAMMIRPRTVLNILISYYYFNIVQIFFIPLNCELTTIFLIFPCVCVYSLTCNCCIKYYEVIIDYFVFYVLAVCCY